MKVFTAYLWTLLLALAFCQASQAYVGTVTVTARTYPGPDSKSAVKTVTVDFIADSSGNATGLVGLTGQLTKVITYPGTPAPTANWDLYAYELLTATISLTGTLLENRHTTTTEVIYPAIAGTGGTVSSFPILAAGNYTFTVNNAGSGGQGKVVFFLR